MTEHATPPTPDAPPLIGHARAFASDPIRAMESWAELGDVVRLRLGREHLYLVFHPDYIKDILVEQQHRFSISPAQEQAFSGVEDHAMTTATGERWRRFRRAAHPAFTRERIAAYRGSMADVCATWVDQWEDGDTFDLLSEMRMLTVRMLGETLLDVDLKGREEIVTEAADAVVQRSRFDRPGQLLPDWVPTPTDRTFRRSVNRLDALVEEIVQERADQLRSDATDVCSILLSAHEDGELSLAEVRGNLVAFMLAGHESPAGALTRAWYLLDRHPEIRERLRAEYDAVVSGDRPTSDEYVELTSTRHVVDETLRLYPPTTGVGRMANEPVHVGGYELPSGSSVIIPQWIPHRDERWWDNPTTFDPERWSADSERPEYAYFPFGGGPRTCIGNDFSRQELTIALATMVGHLSLEVESDGPLTFVPSIQLRPKNDMQATVRSR